MKLVFVILVITLFTMLCVSSVSPALIISSGTSDLSPTWANGQSTLYTDTDGASYEPVWVNGQSTLVVEEF